MAGLMTKAISMMFTAVLGVIFFAYLLVPVTSDALTYITEKWTNTTGIGADALITLLGVVLIIVLMGIAYGAIRWILGDEE